jgi:hypothetical protein
MRSARSGRGLALGAVCAIFAFAAPMSAQAATGAGKARAEAGKAKGSDRSPARTTERRVSNRQYVRFAGRRMGFCIEIPDWDDD